ncbi:MAG: uncharacterized protein QOD99_2331 [Chthoniobacter sp.]|jgi:uncharacterized membrane protein YfcA|nr:uncharacterized protein [Chthoniobacter sp.]
MSPGAAALLFAAGFIAGLMNAIAGGGTILTFPALIFAGLQAIDANATSTIALLPGALAGVFGYRRNIPAAALWIKRFALVSAFGGLIGGILLTRTPPKTFEWLVPFLILFATVLFMSREFFARVFRRKNAQPATLGTRWIFGAIFFQFLVALYGGYFGAGIGILMLASLGMLDVGHIHEMNTVKNVLGFLINIVAAIYFIASGLVHWPAAGAMALGAISGGYSGAHFAQKIPQAVVRHLITGIGITLAAIMFVKQFGGR